MGRIVGEVNGQDTYAGVCDRCEKEIPSVWSGVPNLLDSLDVTIHGGYGEYLDMIYGPVTLVLCEECCDGLMVYLKLNKAKLGQMSYSQNPHEPT